MSKVNERVKELREIWAAFRSSRVLITANNYRVFDLLTTPQSDEAISQKLNIDLRATEILLDALTGLGFLKKSNRKYRNTSISKHFLVKGKPYYQGDIIKHADNLWRNWSSLDEVVKTGKPSQKARDYDAFILGMHNLASLKAKDVMKTIGLKRVKKALDLGGGPGTYSMEMAKKGVKVTLFDHPDAIEIAKRLIEGKRIKDINFRSGDFMVDDIGNNYDLIFVSQILHAYSERDNLQILQKCRKALSEGGRIIVQEFYISEDRTHPPQSSLFSVNMLVNTQEGRCYSPKEIGRWLLATGIKNIKQKLLEDTVLIMGSA
jgi:ubiquinone/menaquinone biosynthesis C-methylase UbiE